MVSFSCPKSFRFECIRCAICCMDTKTHVRHILLLQHEAEHVSNVSLRPLEEFAIEVAGHLPYVYEMKKTPKDRRCVFLEDNSCRIYSIRPLVCRFYPFQLNRRKGQEYGFSAATECPGLGKGELLKRDFFESLFSQACEKFEWH